MDESQATFSGSISVRSPWKPASATPNCRGVRLTPVILRPSRKCRKLHCIAKSTLWCHDRAFRRLPINQHPCSMSRLTLAHCLLMVFDTLLVVCVSFRASVHASTTTHASPPCCTSAFPGHCSRERQRSYTSSGLHRTHKAVRPSVLYVSAHEGTAMDMAYICEVLGVFCKWVIPHHLPYAVTKEIAQDDWEKLHDYQCGFFDYIIVADTNAKGASMFVISTNTSWVCSCESCVQDGRCCKTGVPTVRSSCTRPRDLTQAWWLNIRWNGSNCLAK